MIRASQVRPQYRWTQAPADTVVLDFDDRHRRRVAMTGTRGLEFLLDLENATVLRGGDALVLDDGRLIEVVAAPEPLAITANANLSSAVSEAVSELVKLICSELGVAVAYESGETLQRPR